MTRSWKSKNKALNLDRAARLTKTDTLKLHTAVDENRHQTRNIVDKKPGETMCDSWHQLCDVDDIRPEGHFVASLLDMAKPAKVKGVAKDFEIIASVAKVIACEDDMLDEKAGPGGFDLDDEWVDLSSELMVDRAVRKPQYADILKAGA